ncbi:phosphotransferase [Streptomyces sp. NPDC101455]|uniref:phosphotransferase n=1 Tax=Streptomyces sp. NPDC101455 TaxID=3366142 RepID=UPI00381CBBE2
MPVEVICHGDFAPDNCVFTGEGAVGIVDFDAARPGPGPRAWDLALHVGDIDSIRDHAEVWSWLVVGPWGGGATHREDQARSTARTA